MQTIARLLGFALRLLTGLKRLGSYFFRGARFTGVSKHQNDTAQGSILCKDGSGAVFDTQLRVISTKKNRMVFHAHHDALTQDFCHRALNWLSVLLVDDAKYLIQMEPDGLISGPSRQLFSYRIHVAHTSIRISGDHTITDARQGGRQPNL